MNDALSKCSQTGSRISSLDRNAVARLIQYLGIALSVVLCSSSIAQTDSTGEAKCYELVKGTPYPMCRSFEENLNRFCAKPPMACGLEIGPKFEEQKFSFPAWQSLEPSMNIGLMAKHYKSRVPVALDCKGSCAIAWREKRWSEYLPGLLERIKEGRVFLAEALVDLDRDGEKELTVRMDGGQCNSSERDVFEYPGEPTLAVLANGTREPSAEFGKALSNSNYDVLIHDGRAYLTYWGKWNSKGNLGIYDTYAGTGGFAVTGSVCEFKYQEGKKK